MLCSATKKLSAYCLQSCSFMSSQTKDDDWLPRQFCARLHLPSVGRPFGPPGAASLAASLNICNFYHYSPSHLSEWAGEELSDFFKWSGLFQREAREGGCKEGQVDCGGCLWVTSCCAPPLPPAVLNLHHLNHQLLCRRGSHYQCC